MNKSNSTFDRMCQLRGWLKEQNPKISEAAIERQMGVATNYFKTRSNAPIEEGEKNVRERTLQNLKAAWPEVNIEWVKTGEGRMFVEEQESVIDPKDGTPYYNVDFLGGFDELEDNQTTVPAYYINFQPYNKKGNLWCNITGDSMAPRINSGDKICIREILMNDIIFGEIYAIVTISNLRTVKWVIRSPEEGMIRLVPENKEPRYGDYQDIKISEIRKVFKVVGAVRMF